MSNKPGNKMKTAIATLSLLTVFSTSTSANANAQELLQVCRPRTNNVIQRVTQRMAFPTYPKCRKNNNGIKLRYSSFENLNFIRGTAWHDENGNIYYTIDDTIRRKNSNHQSR